ncbi:hypothetical protein PE36_06187 [Moritella sp. PE36]|uniref:hypothetical protein n=1 Tax=Moritella sp. PE36 TaxID=58051 RepID=UPI00015681C6|nr:hypothetical protein [Moritella sp. PE36]EDM69052.1 hypothetical protein PE36_06187 [Moritella sp. PE36]
MTTSSNFNVNDFLDTNENPHSYYNILPSSFEKKYDFIFNDIDFNLALNEFLKSSVEEIEFYNIDYILVCLLNLKNELINDSLLHSVAEKASEIYSSLLNKGENTRSFRMRLQRLNYFIRDILSNHLVFEHYNTDVKGSDELLDGCCPWDSIEVNNESLTIFSGFNGLEIKNKENTKRYDKGLSTQLDLLSDGKVSIGSYYSKGSFLYTGCKIIHIDHDEPILIVFTYQQQTYALDSKGRLFLLNNGEVSLLILDLSESSLNKARVFGCYIYFFDWSKPYKGGRLNLDTMKIEYFNTSPVIISNDICVCDDFLYIIDKQKGSVFKFDQKFKYIESKLDFGIGDMQLYDPISIRIRQDKLSIISWVNAKQTMTSIF